MLLTACSPPPQTVAADRRDCISAAPAHSGAHRWAPAAAQPAGYLRRTGRDIRLALHHRPDHDLELGGSLGPGLGLRRVRAPGGAGLGWAEAGCAPTPAQGKGSAPLPHANGLRDRRCAGGRQRDAVRLPALRHRRRIPAAAGGRSPEVTGPAGAGTEEGRAHRVGQARAATRNPGRLPPHATLTGRSGWRTGYPRWGPTCWRRRRRRRQRQQRGRAAEGERRCLAGPGRNE